MRTLFLVLLAMPLAACGDTTSNPPIDASTDQSVADGSSADAAGDGSTLQDSAVDTGTDASIPYEAGALDTCNPNVPSSCDGGMKCCSEPTHQKPTTAYICVSPTSNGTCPLLP